MAKATKTRLDESGWYLTHALRAWAETQMDEAEVKRQLEIFTDYFFSHGTPMVNWDATFRNWIRRAPEFTRLPPNTWRAPPELRKTVQECRHGLPAYKCLNCRLASRNGSAL